MADCNALDFGCKLKEGAKDGANNVIVDVAQGWYDACKKLIEWFGSFWIHTPGPDFDSPAIALLTGKLGWYTGAFAIVGLLFALGRTVLTQDIKTLTVEGLRPIVNLIIVTGTYTVGLTALMQAGDEFSVWIIEKAQGSGNGELEAGFMLGLLSSPGLLGGGTFLIVALLLLIASIINVAFMLFRNVVMVCLLVLLPTLGAASGTETGNQAFKKANGWLLAFLLFKPVAALIFALGLALMKDPIKTGQTVEETTQSLVTAITGILILCVAALALPALVKFLVPVAAYGSGGFSGGAAIGAGASVAAGAAVIAASGGTAAAAGGGAAASGGGAAASGGAGGATAGGASTAASGGGGGAGGAAASGGAEASGGGGAASAGSGGTSSAGSGTEAGESASGSSSGAESASSSSGESSTSSDSSSAAGGSSTTSGANSSESSAGTGSSSAAAEGSSSSSTTSSDSSSAAGGSSSESSAGTGSESATSGAGSSSAAAEGSSSSSTTSSSGNTLDAANTAATAQGASENLKVDLDDDDLERDTRS